MPRRKAIRGWDGEEVERWLREHRESPNQCVAALMPHLESDEKTLRAAVQRARRIRDRLRDEEGLNFSKARSRPRRRRRASVHVLPKPAPAPSPVPEPSPAPPSAPEPARQTEQAPPSPPVSGGGRPVSKMNRIEMLEWSVDTAAAATTDGRFTPAPIIKLVAELHEQLESARKEGVSGDVGLSELLEALPRIAPDLPNSVVEGMVAEYLRRNPKHEVSVRQREAG